MKKPTYEQVIRSAALLGLLHDMIEYVPAALRERVYKTKIDHLIKSGLVVDFDFNENYQQKGRQI